MLLCLLAFSILLLLYLLYLVLLSCSIILGLLSNLLHLPCLFFIHYRVLMLYCRFYLLSSSLVYCLLVALVVRMPYLLSLMSLYFGYSQVVSSSLTLMCIFRLVPLALLGLVQSYHLRIGCSLCLHSLSLLRLLEYLLVVSSLVLLMLLESEMLSLLPSINL